ncbi:hypothetical protein J4405_04990, partial [Candidatus Woesearchaeota archaeon]|nr:hypothetical protein [Candidatus Woesearchaeota archaeon]
GTLDEMIIVNKSITYEDMSIIYNGTKFLTQPIIYYNITDYVRKNNDTIDDSYLYGTLGINTSSSLVALYHLDTNSTGATGRWIDETGRNNGTSYLGVFLNSSGYINSAAGFDGVNI